VKRQVGDRSARDRGLLSFLLCALAGVVVSSTLVIALRGGLLWSVLIVLFSACGGGLVGAVLGQER
jgi:hypothetical protein